MTKILFKFGQQQLVMVNYEVLANQKQENILNNILFYQGEVSYTVNETAKHKGKEISSQQQTVLFCAMF